ncbi:MAG: hypothetical protein ABIO76_09310 [Ginsengibacter sp.]
MNGILEQIATDKGVDVNDVIDIFTRFSTLIINKIPELKPVIEDVFINVDPDKLNEHITKMIVLLQEKNISKFKTWTMPQLSYVFKLNENDPLF